MLATVKDSRLVVHTRATPAMLVVLPRLEGRRAWLKGGGLSLEETAHNIEVLRAAFPEIRFERADGGTVVEAQAEMDLKDYTFKRQPDPWQVEALKRMAGKNHFGLFMVQGSGKTKVCLDRAGNLFASGTITGMLVVSKKGVHRQWVDQEAPKDLVCNWVADWWKNKPINPALLKSDRVSLKILTVNFDALKSPKTLKIVEEFCRAHFGKLLIVADESQEIKTHTSARHKALTKLKPMSSHRIIGSGTPIAKDLSDEWAQLLWLDDRILGMKYITTFKAHYCIMGGYENRAVVGHKSLDEYKRKTAPHIFRVDKEDLGMAPKRMSEWDFDLTKRQLDMIREVRKELKATLASGEELKVEGGASAFTKADQIASGFIFTEPGKYELIMPVMQNPRVIAALEWLNANPGKAVIWAHFTPDRDILREALTTAGITFVEVQGDNKMDMKDRFIAEPQTRVFLASQAAAGTGVDGLQHVCRQALYYTNSFKAIDRWQSEDRIDRRGAVGPSNYTDLIATKSLDRHKLRNLAKKEATAAERFRRDELAEYLENEM